MKTVTAVTAITVIPSATKKGWNFIVKKLLSVKDAGATINRYRTRAKLWMSIHHNVQFAQGVLNAINAWENNENPPDFI